jgi:hypothetical protein
MTRIRLAAAGILAAAALGFAAPAQAAADKCPTIEQFESQFREIEARRGYEAAVAWWDKRWPKYHANCILP